MRSTSALASRGSATARSSSGGSAESNNTACFQAATTVAWVALVIHVLHPVRPLAWAGVILLGCSVLRLPPARWFGVAWLQFARVLGWFNTRVILTLTFFLIVTPIGRLFRLCRPVRTRAFLARAPGTYFIDTRRTYPRESFEQPW